MSDIGKHNADRVKAAPIKYKDKQVHLQVQLHITTMHEAYYVYY